jgi:hypothetical protein
MQISKHRLARRPGGGFTDAHPKTRERELREGAGGGRQHRHEAPERECARDDASPVRRVGEPRDRHARYRVERDEGEAGQHSDRRIRKSEVALDGLEQDREDLAIHQIERADEEQNGGHVPSVCDGWPLRCVDDVDDCGAHCRMSAIRDCLPVLRAFTLAAHAAH